MRRLWETASSRLRVKMSINLSTLDRTSRKLRDIHSLGPATREWLVSSAQVSGLASNGITYAGFSEARRGYEFLRRSPPFSMILACEQGEGDVLIDGGWRRCTEGQAYVTSPGCFHAYRIRPGCVWRVSWVLYGEALESSDALSRPGTSASAGRCEGTASCDRGPLPRNGRKAACRARRVLGAARAPACAADVESGQRGPAARKAVADGPTGTR
jgi:hypothetical protein